MPAWSIDELEQLESGDELQLASARGDGKLRKPVTIWVVRAGDDVYVRSVYGRGSGWFRGVQDRHEGRVRSGSVERDVAFVEMDDEDLNDAIDEAYRTKYSRYPPNVLDPMFTPTARAATLRLLPR